MALLVGEARRLQDTHPYTVFHYLAHRAPTQEKAALLHDATATTYHQLGQMVDSLSVWLAANLDRIMRRGEGGGEGGTVGSGGGNCASQVSCDGDGLTADVGKLRTGDQESNPTATTNVATPAASTTTIALCLPRSPVLVALILAIWKRGWAYVPLDPAVPALRTLYVIKDSRPACIITDTQTKIRIKGLETDYALATAVTTSAEQSPVPSYVISERILDITGWETSTTFPNVRNGGMDDVGEEGETDAAQEKSSAVKDSSVCGVEPVCPPDGLACILYTSGSSGDPKGVRLTVENVMNRLSWQWEALPFAEDDVCLMSKSLTFVDSLTEAMVPLLGGAPLVVVKEDAINPELLIRYVCQYGVTRVVAVPSLLKLLLLYLNTTKEATRVLLQQVRVWVTSGEPLPGWLVNDFHATFPGRRLLNLYGSTEVTGDVTWCPVQEVNWKPGVRVPVGTPLHNTAILVLRGEGASGTRTLADVDQIGEVAVLGRNVSPGYLSGYISSSSSSSSNSFPFRPLSSIVIKDEKKKKILYDYLTRVQELECPSQPPLPKAAQTPKTSVSNCEAERKPLPSPDPTPTPTQHPLPSPKPSSTPPTPPPRVKMGTALTHSQARTSTPPPVPPRTSPRIPPRRLSTTLSSPARTTKTAENEEAKKETRLKEEERKQRAENDEAKKEDDAKKKENERGKRLGGQKEGTENRQQPEKPKQNDVNEAKKTDELKKEKEEEKKEQEKEAKRAEEPKEEGDETRVIKKETNPLEELLVYLTGDLGRVCGGQMVLEGRRDSQVKVRGVRVHLAELQDALHCSGYVSNQCVLATGGGGGGGGSTAEPDGEEEDQTLVAFVVLKPEYSDQDTAATEDITRCLGLYLPQAVVPRVVVLDALPHLASGKVDRQGLLRIYRRRVVQHRGSQDGYLILRKEEPIESRVLRIICGALGVSRSQDVLQKNFFDLGGSSITSVSVVVRLRELGLDLTLESFLKAATIGDVVNDILKAKTMAEVMNLFCSPCPAPASTSPTQTSGRRGSRRAEEITLGGGVGGGGGGGGGGGRGDMEEEEEEEEDPVADMGIPALHPDLPVSCRSSPHALAAGKTKGIRLAQLHTLPVSQGVDKATVIEMVAESFAARNPLDVAAGVTRAAHRLLLGNLWPCLVHDDLSFVVKDPKRGILGVAINTDLFNEPQVEVPASMEVIASLHAPLEEEARHYLRQENTFASASPSNAGSRRNSTVGTRRNSGGGSRRNSSTSQAPRAGGCVGAAPRWLHNLYLATSSCLSPQDNVRLSLHLEKEVVKLAKNRLYHGVFTVNSNPLNQLLCETFLGYERTGAVRVNSFMHQGHRPFASLPHHLLLVAMTKAL